MLQFSLNLYFVLDLKLDYNFIQSSQSRLQTPLFSSNSAGRHNSMNPTHALSSWSVDHGHSIPKSDHSSHHPCQILHSSGFWMFYVTNYPWENVSNTHQFSAKLFPSRISESFHTAICSCYYHTFQRQTCQIKYRILHLHIYP